MTFALLFPAGLLALGGLLVPLMLHLARRSELRAIDFSALRWLASRAKPQRYLRVVERGLLLARLLLVAALALLIAGPVWNAEMQARAWTLVVPGADPASIMHSKNDEDVERRWLAPGFPPLDQPQPAAGAPIGSLLRELDAQLSRSSPLTVWVPRELSGLDGSSIELTRTVRWRVVPGTVPVTAASRLIPTQFAVRLAPDRETALKYLHAAWQAWWHDPAAVVGRRIAAPPLIDVSRTSRDPPERSGTLVWMRPGELPPNVSKWILAGGTILIEPRTNAQISFAHAAVVWRDHDGTPLARAARSGRGRVVRLETPFEASELSGLLDGSFAAALREWLHPGGVVSARVLAKDIAPTADQSPNRWGASVQRNHDIDTWFLCLIAIGFVVERFIATAARRWRFT